ncbi:MAG: MBL fold metallo-hydrolase [Pseudomonadota bacterium]
MHYYKVADNTYVIDPMVFGIREFTSVYLLVNDTLTLIDSGSPKSAPLVLDAIRSLGFRPNDVSRIILSHIHFDHASGAGELVKHMPRAKVYVHHKGYQHLIDPSRLTGSAQKVFGTMIDEWYGKFAAVPKERIVTVDDGDTIELGNGRKLRILATPGHAKHEICLYDSDTGSLFTGDEAGIYLPYGPVLIPTTPPPDFDPDRNIETIRRLQALKPTALFFAHYSGTKAVDETLECAMNTLASWKEIVGNALHQVIPFDTITERLKSQTAQKLSWLKGREDVKEWIMNHHIPMCARGYIHYFAKEKCTPDQR